MATMFIKFFQGAVRQLVDIRKSTLTDSGHCCRNLDTRYTLAPIESLVRYLRRLVITAVNLNRIYLNLSACIIVTYHLTIVIQCVCNFINNFLFCQS